MGKTDETVRGWVKFRALNPQPRDVAGSAVEYIQRHHRCRNHSSSLDVPSCNGALVASFSLLRIGIGAVLLDADEDRWRQQEGRFRIAPEMQRIGMVVDVLRLRRMKLHDAFLLSPKQVLDESHLLPCRATR